jgi:transposase-like protein
VILTKASELIEDVYLGRDYQFHLQQNAGAYVPRQSVQTEVAEDIRNIFKAPDKATAQKYLQMIVQKYAKSAPQLSAWLETNLAEGFTVFDFPIKHIRFVRTTKS